MCLERTHLLHDIQAFNINSFALNDAGDDAAMHRKSLGFRIVANIRFLKKKHY